MKEITSRKTRKTMIISDGTWEEIKKLGWAGRYLIKDMPEIKITKPVIIPMVEEKKVTIKKNKK